MKRFAMRCAVVSALGVAMVVLAGEHIIAANADEITIKVVMDKVNKKGMCMAIDEGLKAAEPKWDELAVKTKELVPLAAALPKNKQPKGSDESWKKFSEAYAKAAVDLDKAVAAKDVKAAMAAQMVIGNCRACHTAHRPRPAK